MPIEPAKTKSYPLCSHKVCHMRSYYPLERPKGPVKPTREELEAMFDRYCEENGIVAVKYEGENDND